MEVARLPGGGHLEPPGRAGDGPLRGIGRRGPGGFEPGRFRPRRLVRDAVVVIHVSAVRHRRPLVAPGPRGRTRTIHDGDARQSLREGDHRRREGREVSARARGGGGVSSRDPRMGRGRRGGAGARAAPVSSHKKACSHEGIHGAPRRSRGSGADRGGPGSEARGARSEWERARRDPPRRRCFGGRESRGREPSFPRRSSRRAPRRRRTAASSASFVHHSGAVLPPGKGSRAGDGRGRGRGRGSRVGTRRDAPRRRARPDASRGPARERRSGRQNRASDRPQQLAVPPIGGWSPRIRDAPSDRQTWFIKFARKVQTRSATHPRASRLVRGRPA